MEAAGKKRSRKTKLVCRQVVELDEELQKLINATQDLKSHETDEVYNTVAIVDPKKNEVKTETVVKSGTLVETENLVKTETLFVQTKKTPNPKKRKENPPDRKVNPPEFDGEEPPEFDENELEKDKEWFQELDIKEDPPIKDDPPINDDSAEISVASKLSKLKGDINDESDNSFQFSVNIEVEEFDSDQVKIEYDNELNHVDDDFCIETSNLGELSLNKDNPFVFDNPYAFRDHDYEKPLDLLSRDDINQIIHEDVEENGANSDGGGSINDHKLNDPIDKEEVLNKMEKLKNNKGLKYLSPQYVLQITKEALWKEIEDMKEYVGPVHKAIQINMINSFGKLFDTVIETSEMDEKLNQALESWNTWHRITLEPIYSYKCYLCRKAWYHLNELKLHLKNHKDYTIDIEVQNCTCNLIVYVGEYGEPPEMQMIPMSGKCPICVKSSEDHEIYTCFGCSYLVQSCSRLRIHEGACPVFKKVYKQKYGEDAEYINCVLCDMYYFSKDEYVEHFIVKHIPRSDYVVPFRAFKHCSDCKNKIVCPQSHDCSTKTYKNKHRCDPCGGNFNTWGTLKLHDEVNKCKMNCKFCGEPLHRRCSEANHMMTHTNKYVAVFRCVYCVSEMFFFKNLEGLKLHKELFHADRSNRVSKYGQRMIVPAKCFDVANESIQSQIDNESRALEEQLAICNNIPNPDPSTITGKLETDLPTKRIIKRKKVLKRAKRVPKNKKPPPKKKRKPLNSQNITPISDNNNDENEVTNYEMLLSDIFEQSGSSGLKEATMQVMSNDNKDSSDMKDVIDVKEEPMEYDEGLMSGSIYNMTFYTDESTQIEGNYVDIEPEIILHSFLKRSYKCAKCGYLGCRKEYKEHVAGHCKPKPAIDPLVPGNLKQNSIFRCTKCTEENTSLKGYIKHLKDHGLAKLECPECGMKLKCNTTLANHIVIHIKDLFQRIVSLSDEQIRQNYCFRCKVCKLELVDSDFFEHWESHLQLKVIKHEYDPDSDYSEHPLSRALPKTWPVSKNYQSVMPIEEFELPPPNLTDLDNAAASTDPMLKRIDSQSMKLVIEYLMQNKMNRTRAPHFCMLCAKRFQRTSEVKRHLIEHLLIQAFANKPKTKGLQCQVCGMLHERPDNYKHHMRDHARLPVYTCQLCNRSFSDSSNFTKHKKVHNYKVLICEHCGRKFHTKACIVKHMESHLKKNLLRCKECNAEFPLKSDLTRHYKRIHLGTKTLLSCPICRKKFANPKTKLDHMWHVHKERVIIADCNLCGQKFRKHMDLKYHMKYKHPGLSIDWSHAQVVG